MVCQAMTLIDPRFGSPGKTCSSANKLAAVRTLRDLGRAEYHKLSEAIPSQLIA